MSPKRYFSIRDLEKSFETTDKVNFFIILKNDKVIKIPVMDTVLLTNQSTEGEIVIFKPLDGDNIAIPVEQVALFAESDSDDFEVSSPAGNLTLSPQPLLIRNTDLILDTKYTIWELFSHMGAHVANMSTINRVCGICTLNIAQGSLQHEHKLKFNLPVTPNDKLTFPLFETEGGNVVIAQNFKRAQDNVDTIYKHSDAVFNKTQVRGIKWDYSYYRSTWANGSQIICNVHDYLENSGDKIVGQELLLTLRLTDGNILYYNMIATGSNPALYITEKLKLAFSEMVSFARPGTLPMRGNQVLSFDITDIEDYSIEFNSIP